MRSLTPAAAAQAANLRPSEPFLVVKLELPSPAGTRWYGDKMSTVGTLGVDGRIVRVSPLRQRAGFGRLGTSSAVQITLGDHDLALKQLFDTARLEGFSATVFHAFEGLAEEDLVPLLVGKIGGPVRWAEASRELSLTIASTNQSDPVGEVTESEDPEVPNSARGRPWPVCFGKVREAPTLLYRQLPAARTLERVEFGQLDLTVDVPGYDETPRSIFGSGSSLYLLGEELVLGGYTASGAGNRFLILQRNLNRHTLGFGVRPVGADQFNPYVAWLSLGQEDVNVVNMWVTIGTRRRFCIGQQGLKLWFQTPWHFLIQSATGTARAFEPTTRPIFSGGIVVGQEDVGWVHPPGTQLRPVDSLTTYIVHSGSGASVEEVKAYKRVPKGETTERELVCVPTDYYTVSSTTVEGKSATVLNFEKPLSQIDDTWSDEPVFASVTAPGTENTADQIQSILTSYTDIIPDPVSFAAVRSKVANYPSGFAVADRPDALRLVNDIAWQARCGLVVVGSQAFLRFLPEAPTQTVLNIQNENIDRDSLSLSTTGIEDVVTELSVVWRPSYAEEDQEIDLPLNASLYGSRPDERRIFIYQYREGVLRAGRFWQARLGNVWKNFRATVFLDALRVELLDHVTIDIGDIFESEIPGQVMEIRHDSENHLIELDVWLPVKVGTTVVAADAYPGNPGGNPGDPFADLEECTIEQGFRGRVPEFLLGKPNAIRGAEPGLVSGAMGGPDYTVSIFPNGYDDIPADSVIASELKGATDVEEGTRILAFQSQGGEWYFQKEAEGQEELTGEEILDLINPIVFPFDEDDAYPFRIFIGRILSENPFNPPPNPPPVTGWEPKTYNVELLIDGLPGQERETVLAYQIDQRPDEILPANTVVFVYAIRRFQGANFWRYYFQHPTYLA